jgi:glyoxylase-like metal-dependent hydrolase (beta-lactamase superfamily II)
MTLPGIKIKPVFKIGSGMSEIQISGNHIKLDKLKILLPGIPGRSSRGWFGYCTVILFPLANSWALFDTGHYSDRAILLHILKAKQIDPAAIGTVVLSHLHFDHMLNLSLFKNATILVSKSELDYARMVSDGELEDPSIPDFWSFLLKDRDIQLVEDSLEIERGIELVTLPGHTPGCLAMFYQQQTTVAVCGDVIKNGWEAFSGKASDAGVDDQKIAENIAYIRNRAEVIIPGHDRPFIFRDNGLEYLTDGAWQVQGSFFPQPQNEVLLNINMKGGYFKVPE